jgi:hypothetical protein
VDASLLTHKLIGAAIHNVKGGEAEMRKKSDNRRRPWSRTVLARPNDRGHVFHTGDAHRVLIALGCMEDTLKERHRINKELVAACEPGRLEKVDREGSPVDPRSSRSGMWRRVLSLAETGRPKGKAK